LDSVLNKALPQGGDDRNTVSKSRSSASASTEIKGKPIMKSAHSGLNIQAGKPDVVSSGNRTKMYSPCRSFCLFCTRSCRPDNGCHR
jgi:hypothetical protein